MVLDHETWYSNGLFVQSAAAGCQVLAGTEHTTVNKTVPVDGCVEDKHSSWKDRWESSN